jgi:hypothetical protein
LLFGEPLKCDFRFPAGAGGTLDGAQGATVFLANRAIELSAICSKHAPEPANRYAEVVEGLAIESVVESAFRGDGCVQSFERQTSSSLLFASRQEIVGQCRLTPELGVTTGRRKLRDLGRRDRIIRAPLRRSCSDGRRISGFAGNEASF